MYYSAFFISVLQIEGLPAPSVEATLSQVLEPDAAFDKESQDSAEVCILHVCTCIWPGSCDHVT